VKNFNQPAIELIQTSIEFVGVALNPLKTIGSYPPGGNPTGKSQTNFLVRLETDHNLGLSL
ncbi:uncharacterized protein METZ01_LOCUS381320, partial [marine metagenome]